MPEARGPFEKFVNTVCDMVEGPVVWFRETVVVPNRQEYPWYHQKFRRVPTIDQCYTDDVICEFEANQQYKRDRLVDNSILSILRRRIEDCQVYEAPDNIEKCTPLFEEYKKAEENWFIKYGDLGAYANARRAFFKQKHRMVWERRHGPVGSGMSETKEAA